MLLSKKSSLIMLNKSLEQAKNQGVAGEKLNALEERLALIVQAPKSTLSEQKKS